MIKPVEVTPLNIASEFCVKCPKCGVEYTFTQTPPVNLSQETVEQKFTDLECDKCGACLIMTIDELVEELSEKHIQNFPEFGNRIPASVLSFSASDFLEVVSRTRASELGYKDFDKLKIVESLYKDFTDPQGLDEMSKLITGLSRKQ